MSRRKIHPKAATFAAQQRAAGVGSEQIARELREKFNVDVSERSVRRVLRSQGLSAASPSRSTAPGRAKGAAVRQPGASIANGAAFDERAHLLELLAALRVAMREELPAPDLARCAAECRAIGQRLTMLDRAAQLEVSDEAEDAAAERTRAKLQRLAQLEADRRAARLATLPEAERRVVERFLSGPALVAVPSMEAADG